MLIVHLLLSRYLGEAFASTAYSVNVYIIPGELAIRLTRFTRADILAGKGPRIHCAFRRHQRRCSATDATAGKKRKKPVQTNSTTSVNKAMIKVDDARVPMAAGPSRLPHLQDNARAKKKRPYEYIEASEEDEGEVDELVDDIDDGGEDFTHAIRMIDAALPSDVESSEDGDGDVGGGGDWNWEYSLRPSMGTKKRKVSLPPKGPSKQANERDSDVEVIALSSD